MTEEEIKSKIDSIVKDVLDYDELDIYAPYMSLMDDLGADSLDAVDILIRLETEFDISIPQEDIDIDCTVQDIYDYIISKVD